MGTSRRSAVAASAALVLSLAACSGGSDDPGAAKQKSAPAKTRGAPTAASAQRGLLSATVVGKSFRRIAQPTKEHALPCLPPRAPGLKAATSASAHVAVRLESATQRVTLLEELFAYPNAAAADAAFDAARQGMDCAHGAVYRPDGSRVAGSIGASRDLRAELTVDGAYSWPIRTEDAIGAQTVILTGRCVVTIQMTIPLKGKPGSLPDAIEIARRAGDAAAKV